MRVTLSFKTICGTLLLISLHSPPARAQQTRASGPNSPGDARLTAYVRNRMGPDSRLYNGTEYIRNGIPAKGFAFFDADSLQTGYLSYDGIVYPDILIEYDLVLDKVIIQDYSHKALIGLISEKLDSFSIGSHSFRYVPAGNPASNPPVAGFYEMLFSDGPVLLLARHEKKLFFPTNREEQPKYEENNTHFLFIHDRYFHIEGKDGLLDALKDKKDLLKKFIRENKLHFKKHLETALIQTTAYYLQISH